MVFLLSSNLQKAAVYGFMVRRVSFAFYRVLCNFSKTFVRMHSYSVRDSDV
ncbi:hypothetical protein HMPREF0733_11526 [Rothia dentocariosa ATCC 17931]|uniref:Uncharacterized protein n=1 Tax=Rothia dentocariosa (strain ATCC 17931 / CDC X599 / XDIA) TaxID=762948 RepID=E3H013_ROTDC|nr:hypothetical protein HMPREF0733_11526 [Rothia dentocariosa ATCC 17931]